MMFKDTVHGILIQDRCLSATLRLSLHLGAHLLALASAQPTTVQSGAGGLLSPFAGEVFVLQVTGANLSRDDRVSIVPLDIECNATGAAGSDGPFAKPLASEGQVGSSGRLSTSQKWTNLLSDHVGTFRVCWCGASNCTMDDDFNAFDHEVGTLEIRGPVVKDVECIVTETCVVELVGNGFSPSAGLLILESGECGALNPVAAHWGGMTNPKILSGSQSGDTFLMTAFVPRRDLREELGHRICWAYSPSSLEDYRVDVGEFRMSPSAVPIFPRCSFGRECKFRLEGTGFAPSNKILISSASACGRSGAANVPGFANPQQVVGDLYSFGTIMSDAIKSEAVGLYRLCWAHDATAPFEWLFLLYVGSLSICGPLGVTNGYGTLLLPGAGEKFDLEVHGFCLGDDDRARIVLQSSDCPVAKVVEASSNDTEALDDLVLNDGVPHVPDIAGDAGSTADNSSSRVWRGLSASQAMSFRVCWCSGISCSVSSAFNVEAGQFAVRGPVAMLAMPMADSMQMMVAGEEFYLEVIGFGLRNSDRILILHNSMTCGLAISDAELEYFSNTSKVNIAGVASESRGSDSSTHAKWVHLQINSAGSFRVCWCGSSCTVSSEFSADMGVFKLAGPEVSDGFSCIVTGSCNIKLTGAGLSDTNGMIILASGDCGDPMAEIATWVGIANPQNVTELADSASFAVFSFGIAMSGPVGATALACWGSAPSPDSASAAEYPVRVGRFVMYGPEPLHTACELGTLCQLTAEFLHPDCGIGEACTSDMNRSASDENNNAASSPLLGISSTVLIAVPEGCASAAAASFPGTSNPAPLKMSSSPDYNFGVPTQGSCGIYDLCWRLGTDVGPGLAFGTLSVFGPSALTGWNGTSLRPPPNASFSLEIVGMALQSQDRIRIIRSTVSCGSAESYLNAGELKGPLAENPDTPGSVNGHMTLMGASVSLAWHDLVLTAPGIFSVCWCGQEQCAAGQDFNVLAGQIVLPRAQLWMESPAVAGNEFNLELVGKHLVSSIRVGLFDDRFHCGSEIISAQLVNPAILSSPGTSGSTGNISTSLRWLGLQVDGPANFTACWCTLDCFSSADFVGSLGIIEVLGPVALQPMICIVTALCEIQLAGSGYAPSNSVLLVESSACGFPGAPVPMWEGFVNPRNVTRGTAVNAVTYKLGTPAARPAEYGSSELTVCWASHPPAGSSKSEDFPVLIGALTVLLGPANTSLQCFLGDLCVLELTGTGLGPSSVVRIASSDGACIQPSVINVHGFTNPKELDNTGSPPSHVTLGTYTFGRAMSGALGDYVLCWSHGSQELSPTSSSLEVGTLSLLGPSSVADGFGSALSPYMGDAFVLEILGYGLSLSNRIRVLAASDVSECGQVGSQPSSPLVGDVLLDSGAVGSTGIVESSLAWHGLTMQAPGFFQVCWCNQGCNSDSDFNVFVGKFNLSGPLDVLALSEMIRAAPAIAGKSFTLEVRGVGLVSQDQLKIVAASSACEAAGPVSSSKSLSAVTANRSSRLRWGFVRIDQAGEWNVCWCHAPCLGSSASYIWAGSFSVLGPAFQHTVCTATLPCNIKLQGDGFSKSNGVHISHHESCSGYLITTTKWAGLQNPQEVSKAVGSNDTYVLGIAQSGVVNKVMNVCWRSGADIEGYRVLAGNFILHGPVAFVQTVCTISKSCVVKLNVSTMLFGGSLLVSSTPCAQSTPLLPTSSFSNPQVASNVFEGMQIFDFGHISNPQQAGAPVQQEKMHWLCWAAAPSPNSKVHPSNHVWEAGRMTVVNLELDVDNGGKEADVVSEPHIENDTISQEDNTTSANLSDNTSFDATDVTGLLSVQCVIITDIELESIHYAGEDIFSTVSDNLSETISPMNFTFAEIIGKYLVISARGVDSRLPCVRGGLQVTCSNGISSSIFWEVFGSSTPIDTEHQRGDGNGWGSPCLAASGLFQDGGPVAIWAAESQYAAFRWRSGNCGLPPRLELHHPDSSKRQEQEGTESMSSSLLPACSKARATHHGQSCQQKCPEGYQPSSQVLSCWNGKFDADVQHCFRVRCAAAPESSITFASVQNALSACAGSAFGDFCEVPCPDGRPGGSMKCSASGEWIGNISCLKLCSQTLPASQQHEEATCSQHKSGDNCEVPCSGDFQGSVVMNCLDGSWVPSVTSQTCEKVNEMLVPQVVVSMVLQNITYASLVADPILHDLVKAVMQTTIAARAGHGVVKRHVQVVLSEGSVVVDATVMLPSGTSSTAVRAQLMSAKVELAEEVTEELSKMKGLNHAATGKISISAVRVTGVTDDNDGDTSNAEGTAVEANTGSPTFVYVLCSLIVFVLVVVACVRWWRRPKRKKESEESEDGEKTKDGQDDLERQKPKDAETFQLDEITDSPNLSPKNLSPKNLSPKSLADAAKCFKSHEVPYVPALPTIGEAAVVEQEMLPTESPSSVGLAGSRLDDLSPQESNQAEAGEIREEPDEKEDDKSQDDQSLLTPIMEDECAWADTLTSIRNPNDSGYLRSQPANLVDSSTNAGSSNTSPSRPDPMSPAVGGQFFTIEDDELDDEPLVAPNFLMQKSP